MQCQITGGKGQFYIKKKGAQRGTPSVESFYTGYVRTRIGMITVVRPSHCRRRWMAKAVSLCSRRW